MTDIANTSGAQQGGATRPGQFLMRYGFFVLIVIVFAVFAILRPTLSRRAISTAC